MNLLDGARRRPCIASARPKAETGHHACETSLKYRIGLFAPEARRWTVGARAEGPSHRGSTHRTCITSAKKLRHAVEILSS